MPVYRFREIWHIVDTATTDVEFVSESMKGLEEMDAAEKKVERETLLVFLWKI